jgi:parvulin-like peptidyl-prolyl isomerase
MGEILIEPELKNIMPTNSARAILHIRGHLFLFILPLAILSACGQGQEDKSALSDNVVAIVNKEYIYREDFENGLEQFLSKYKITQANSREGQREPKDIVLDQLIQNKLFDQEIKRLNITITAKELEDELREITGEYTQEELSRKLKEKAVPFETWKDKIRRNLIIRKLLEREVIGKITVDDKEMLDYYQANAAAFSLPKRAGICHIIVSDESEAHGIYKELLAGANFSELAQKYSLGFEATSGGKMGVFSPGQLPEEFDKVIFNLKPGQYSDVIKTPYGYHLFMVVKIMEAKKMGLEEAKIDIRKNLIKKKENDAYARWLNNLKAISKIVINNDYFKKIREKQKNA